MHRPIFFTLICCLFLGVLLVTPAQSQTDNEAKIQSAVSAAPWSVSNNATVNDWPSETSEGFTTLREGSNGWTCLPDTPGTPGNDPMCVDQPWLEWINAWVNKTEVNTTRMAFGYMLQANDSPFSNTDPYATEETADNEWNASDVPHLMILVPDAALLEGLSTDPETGGPWVMWRNTPYVHIMAPMPLHTPEVK